METGIVSVICVSSRFELTSHEHTEGSFAVVVARVRVVCLRYPGHMTGMP